MKTLFVAFFVGACCFLLACKGHNNLEKHKQVAAVKTDRVSGQRFHGEETVPSLLVRTDRGEFYLPVVDEDIDRLIEKINSQLELADLGVIGEAVVYKNLGASYLEQGKLDKAVVAFKKAVQIAPSFVEAHYLLADVYSIKGEGGLSRKFLDKAMALEGSYIIDTIRIVDETHTIIESTPPAVIRSEEIIELPPEFFEDPGKIGVPRKWKSPPK